MTQSSRRDLIASLDDTVIGRRREVELVVAALDADRHVLLEGPPGTGKSTLLRAVAEGLGIGFVFVEGNAELTPARLVGHFDPARVLTDGYERFDHGHERSRTERAAIRPRCRSIGFPFGGSDESI